VRGRKRKEKRADLLGWDEMMANVRENPPVPLPRKSHIKAVITTTRPWRFLPGDKVMVLTNNGFVNTVVVKVQIPGPKRKDDIIQVRIEGALDWWPIERVEEASE
jgi:hypothetical protein